MLSFSFKYALKVSNFLYFVVAVNADVFVEIFNGPDGRPSGVGLVPISSS
jgi:hypothetical protein